MMVSYWVKVQINITDHMRVEEPFFGWIVRELHSVQQEPGQVFVARAKMRDCLAQSESSERAARPLV